MKVLSAKKFSVLGIVLIAASAVTAAIIPAKDKSEAGRFEQNGSLTASINNPNQQTCKPTAATAKNCHDTATGAGSLTTAGSDVSESNSTTIGDIS